MSPIRQKHGKVDNDIRPTGNHHSENYCNVEPEYKRNKLIIKLLIQVQQEQTNKNQ